MSEDKKSLINLVPDSVDNAVKNITDKSTQNIGTTLADIWYLVFGGISQAAEKRKLKYSYALQEFENELEKQISKIPHNKVLEPDIQIIAPALEAAKYCVEKKELRIMFAKLISSSLNSDTNMDVLPIFTHIVSNLRPIDAKIIMHLNPPDYVPVVISPIDIFKSLNLLESLNLIETMSYDSVPYNVSNLFFVDNDPYTFKDKILNIIIDTTWSSMKVIYTYINLMCKQTEPNQHILFHHAKLTKMGEQFINVCLPNKVKPFNYPDVIMKLN